MNLEPSPALPPARLPGLSLPASTSLVGPRQRFHQQGFVRLTGALPAGLHALISAEARRLEPLARRRDFVMAGYETPRLISTLGGRKIAEQSAFLAALYEDPSLRAFLESVAGEPLYRCQHPDEFMVLNFLTGTGATHGWHLDDPAYAFVVVLEAPPEQLGGVLEFIPGWRGLCVSLGLDAERSVDPTAEQLRLRGRVSRAPLAAGEAYLLRADENLHRVTELLAADARRVVLNLAFERSARTSYGHTATSLYGEP